MIEATPWGIWEDVPQEILKTKYYAIACDLGTELFPAVLLTLQKYGSGTLWETVCKL